MKVLIYIVFFGMVLLACKSGPLEELTYEEYQTFVMESGLPDSDKLVLRDEYGHRISKDSLTQLQKKHDFYDIFFKNEKGKIVEFQLRRKPPLKILPINCSNVAEILDSVYLSDQKDRSIHDPRKDYRNLEIVNSIIEQCGMPKDQKSLRSVFFVIQHNHSIHQRAYFSGLREASERGLLNRSYLAMMDDRIRMNEDKPQLYGTQVIRNSNRDDWELYDLYDPSKVNVRRKEVGLEPIDKYLKHFDIEFNSDQ